MASKIGLFRVHLRSPVPLGLAGSAPVLWFRKIPENFVWSLFGLSISLFDPAEIAPGSAQLINQLNRSSMQVCRDDFEKALKDVETDPANAIGMASTTLESLCKAILDTFEVPYPNDESLQPLLKSVLQTMKLSPEGHADQDLKRVLGGLSNAGSGLAVLRTKYSTFHGKGSGQLRLEKRHARLAVNALTTVGLFLIETYIEVYNEKKKINKEGVLEFYDLPPEPTAPPDWEPYHVSDLPPF